MLNNKLSLNLEKIRKDFVILNQKVHGHRLVYLDNASTSQKPIQVIEAINNYYQEYNANVHRGIYELSEKSTHQYELAHRKVAVFIGASFEEIIFTRGTTESINLLAYSLGQNLKPGDEIVLTQMEHHSNIVPWQEIAKRQSAQIKYIPITSEGELDLDAAKKIITDKTKIVSVAHVSNVLGTINPVKEIGQIAHNHNALFIVDGAQSVPNMAINVKEINCDFLAFSGHKMIGPTGIGVLYGKKDLLEKMSPFLYGGDMIREVSFQNSSWNCLPWKFEAGTPNIVGGIGLGIAIDYLKQIGMKEIEDYEKEITAYALKRLQTIEDLVIYGPKDPEKRIATISFNVKGIHAHDLATILDREGIAVRGGHHCAMPLMNLLGITASARASFYFYNTFEDVDALIEGIKKAKKVFKL
ncbi:cysteine desulfurase [Candidatus Woesearchaeota archaeon]|nr:cysteine desulfurase [Candidatus Woesearchaeota archaeon]